MAELKNKLTWSASRHGTFSYCKRQYWWGYYGSWGGWNRDAPAQAREAYMLKNLAKRKSKAAKKLEAELEEQLRNQRRVEVTARSVSVTDGELQELKALGYVN